MSTAGCLFDQDLGAGREETKGFICRERGLVSPHVSPLPRSRSTSSPACWQQHKGTGFNVVVPDAPFPTFIHAEAPLIYNSERAPLPCCRAQKAPAQGATIQTAGQYAAGLLLVPVRLDAGISPSVSLTRPPNLSLSLSLCLSVCLCLSLCLSLFLSLSLSLSASL